MSKKREYTLRVRTSWIKYGFAALVAALVLAPVAVNASHNFTDVPDTHIFHSDIAWMADNGITSGCTPTEYCPGDNVTRGQMAKFLRNVAENEVVDAKTVGGVLPAVGETDLYWPAVTSSTATVLDSFDVTVESAGTLYLQVGGNYWLDADATTDDELLASATMELCEAPDTVATADCGPQAFGFPWGFIYSNADDANGGNDTPAFTLSLVTEVPSAGTYTFYVNGISSTYGLNSWGVKATAMFFPGTLEMDGMNAPAPASAAPKPLLQDQ